MAGNKAEDKRQYISVGQAAALFNKSERFIQILVAEGYIEKSGHGRYTIPAVTRGFAAYMDALLEKANKSAAASRATDARTREIELRIAERERSLIPLDDALAVTALVFQMVRTSLTSLPARLTRDRKLRGRYEQVVNDELNRLADAARKGGDDLRSGRLDLDAVAAAGSGGVGGR